jgi:hypothetical protein
MDSVDKIIETAKKLRKYSKKLADPAFANLVADINMALADLKLQLAGLQPEKPAPATRPASANPTSAHPVTTTLAPDWGSSPTAQLNTNFDSVFGDDPDKRG